MQALVMTEMLRATAKFQPNGHPISTEDGHRRAFLNQLNQERQTHTPRKVRCTLRAKLTQFLVAFRLQNRIHHEVS